LFVQRTFISVSVQCVHVVVDQTIAELFTMLRWTVTHELQ